MQVGCLLLRTTTLSSNRENGKGYSWPVPRRCRHGDSLHLHASGLEIDAAARGIARRGCAPAGPSDALGQTHICRDCGEAIRDRDHRAVFCLHCVRRRKNARDRAYNKANRSSLTTTAANGGDAVDSGHSLRPSPPDWAGRRSSLRNSGSCCGTANHLLASLPAVGASACRNSLITYSGVEPSRSLSSTLLTL